MASRSTPKGISSKFSKIEPSNGFSSPSLQWTTTSGASMLFERAILLGDTRSSIVLQTRLGNEIENSIEPEVGELEIRKFRRLVELHGVNWEIRRQATGRYNCAGLVFANRRTSVFKPELYLKIMHDDGYRKLESEHQLHCGDIAAYIDTMSNEIDHVALILRLEKGIASGGSPIPFVLSKWNSASGEVIHNIYKSPYDLSKYRIDYWTDRPSDHGSGRLL